MATNGLALRGLASTTPPTRAEIEGILRRILTPNPDLPVTTTGPHTRQPPA
ncbi:hypothetical protein [Streptomyces abikoensis]|uniref:hypothetical protein n=1 Tax=Streptomyces abikoensis TaxID=97398 RepID=UPI00340FF423